MINYYKEDNNINEKLAKKTYTEIFTGTFYLVGIALIITDKICEEYNIDKNLTTEDLKEKINKDPVSVKLLFNIIEEIYDKTIMSNNSSLSICYTIKQIQLYLRTLYNYGYKNLQYNDYKMIFRMLIDYGQRDVTKYGIKWYENYGDELNRYWKNNIIVDENSFELKYNDDNELVGGEYMINPNRNIIEKELYVYLCINNVDYIKFIYDKNTNEIDIIWHVIDILENYGDKINDEIFNKYGSIMIRAILEDDEKINIKGERRHITFIEIIKKDFKLVSDTKYSIESPWGKIIVDIDNIYKGKLVNK